MRILLFLVWSLACVGVGVALATVEVGGKTPWQQANKSWKSDGEKRLTTARDSASMLVDDVKKTVSVAAKDVKDKPLDRHSEAERDALERLISDRAKK